jgi:hypothetical protein
MLPHAAHIIPMHRWVYTPDEEADEGENDIYIRAIMSDN